MNISDPYVAYCVDNAVATFGTALENELEKVEAKTDKQRSGKQSVILAKWLDEPVRYRNPPAPPKKGSGPVEKVETFSATGIDVMQS